MTQRTQFDRAYATGESVSGQPEGTPFVNFADLRLQVQGPTGPLDLLAIRPFSESAQYQAGDIVAYAGGIYTASALVPAGPWDAGAWTSLVADPFSPLVGEAGWDFAITYTDDQPTEVVFASGALRVRETLGYNTAGDVETVAYETSTNDGVDYASVGTLLIGYDADGNALAGTWT
jgi:hypothetical protein